MLLESECSCEICESAMCSVFADGMLRLCVPVQMFFLAFLHCMFTGVGDRQTEAERKRQKERHGCRNG